MRHGNPYPEVGIRLDLVGSVVRTRYYGPTDLGDFFFNHLGSKNTNFSVGLCYILELVSLKFRI